MEASGGGRGRKASQYGDSTPRSTSTQTSTGSQWATCTARERGRATCGPAGETTPSGEVMGFAIVMQRARKRFSSNSAESGGAHSTSSAGAEAEEGRGGADAGRTYGVPSAAARSARDRDITAGKGLNLLRTRQEINLKSQGKWEPPKSPNDERRDPAKECLQLLCPRWSHRRRIGLRNSEPAIGCGPSIWDRGHTASPPGHGHKSPIARWVVPAYETYSHYN